MSQVLRECGIGMLDCRNVHRGFELNVHFSTICCLKHLFREFGSTSNQPHNHRAGVTTPAQDRLIRLLLLWDRLRWEGGIHSDWLAHKWVGYALQGPLVAAPLPSHVKCIDLGQMNIFQWIDFLI